MPFDRAGLMALASIAPTHGRPALLIVCGAANGSLTAAIPVTISKTDGGGRMYPTPIGFGLGSDSGAIFF